MNNQIKIICDTKSLKLKCSYDDRGKAKMIAGYKWNRTEKMWDYPLNEDTFKALLAMFPSADVPSYVKDELKKKKDKYANYGLRKKEIFNEKFLYQII